MHVAGGYKVGCRCEPCVAHHNAYHREYHRKMLIRRREAREAAKKRVSEEGEATCLPKGNGNAGT